MTSPTSKPTRQLLIDVSLIKESNCLRRFHYLHDKGLTARNGIYKMEYGSAGHEYLKHRYRNLLPDRSNAEKVHEEAVELAFDYYVNVTVPEDDWRTIDHLISVLGIYHIQAIQGQEPQVADFDGKKGVELKFGWPYKRIELENELIEVILCGTIDLILKNPLGGFMFMDHKFTSVWDKKGYLSSYNLSPQMAFYSRILRKLLKLDYNPSAIINTFFIKKPSIKNPFDLVDIQQSDVITFPHTIMSDFVDYFNAMIESMIKASIDKKYTPNFACCETKYGKCQFFGGCQIEFEEDRVEYFNSTMKQRKYDPRSWA